MPTNASEIFSAFTKLGLTFFTGVPDSALGTFCAYVVKMSKAGECRHMTAANEGNAIGIAAGSYLASGTIPVVYMQNSGLGNAVNPLTSLAHSRVYSIPMVVMIGHRGKPGQSDEPQHLTMGSITKQLIALMGFGFLEVSNLTDNIHEMVKLAVTNAKEKMEPFFLIFERDVISNENYFSEFKLNSELLGYYEVINKLVTQLKSSDIVFSTTGYISRVTEEIVSQSQSKPLHFMNVGSMGHLSSIALGYTRNRSNVNESCTLVIDGDGSSLMHLGGLLSIKQSYNYLKNVSFLILNNSSHFSVGGQPTSFPDFRFTTLFSIEESKYISQKSDLDILTRSELFKDQLTFFEIKIGAYIDKSPPRPSRTPLEIKQLFLNQLV